MINEGVWALVPARGGSKRIPDKNVRPLGGLPLVCHVVGTLSGLLPKERIVVSTDDPVVEHLCASAAIIHERSRASARDDATLDEVAVGGRRLAALVGSGARRHPPDRAAHESVCR